MQTSAQPLGAPQINSTRSFSNLNANTFPAGGVGVPIPQRSLSPNSGNFLNVPGAAGGFPAPRPGVSGTSTGYVINGPSGASRLIGGGIPNGAAVQRPGIISAGSHVGHIGTSRPGIISQQVIGTHYIY